MKTITLSFSLICMAFLVIAQPDQQSVTIEEAVFDSFDKLPLANGVQLYRNRDYIVENLPADWDGFEFLQGDAKVAEQGTITASAAGKIYLIAKSSEAGLTGWTLVEGSQFTYTDFQDTEAAIFEKDVTAGEVVDIPNITNFNGVQPIAKSINLITAVAPDDASLKAFKVDGLDMETFHVDSLSYTFYLPYTYDSLPSVEATPLGDDAMYMVTQELTNITGTEEERTFKFSVTSEDETVTLDYEITFEQLPELDLFLCIGQSNMAGRAEMDTAAGDFIPVEDAYLMMSTTQFKEAVNPFNLYSNIRNGESLQRVNPVFSFSQNMTTALGKKIGFVVNAKGGSDMVSWDIESEDSLYHQTLTRALEAQKWGTYKAILWHQGESNSTTLEVEAYPEQLSELVSNLRSDLGDEDLFFVAGKLGTWNSSYDNFNLMIDSISTFVENAAVVSSDGLTNRDDSHFDRVSQIELGNRYAAKVLEEVYSVSVSLISVTVDGDGYEQMTFENGAALIKGGSNAISNVPSNFSDFEFLAVDTTMDFGGVIIPSTAGEIYLLAPSGGLTDWMVVDSSEFDFSDSNYPKFSVYARTVVLGDTIEIPSIEGFVAALPIAKEITYIAPEEPEEPEVLSKEPNEHLTEFNFWYSSGKLFVNLEKGKLYDLHIYDLSGRAAVFKSNYGESTVILDELKQGIYVVRLQLGNEVLTRRISVR